MKHCSHCVLPDSFPGITFDEKEVCNYCTNSFVPDDDKKDQYLQEFEKLLNEKKGKHQYDVIVAFSGGKDSTKTLKMLSGDYGLNCLAWTFDNGFLSDQARKNILSVTDALNATSMIVKPPFEHMKLAFRAAAEKDIYNTKTLDRASSICTTCIGFVKSMILKTALEMDIPLVAYGWSPGQAPISSAIRQTTPALHKFSDRTIKNVLLKNTDELLGRYFLSEIDYDIPKERWPINIHPLAFTEYNEEKIIDEIAAVGWNKPDDTDPNSTNCTLNALANYIHRKRFNFHPYAWEIAGIVRSGNMNREEGVVKTTQDEDMNMVNYAAKRLDLNVT